MTIRNPPPPPGERPNPPPRPPSSEDKTMMRFDIITGKFNPPHDHADKGKRFKFIAIHVYRYGQNKGEWAFEFYETDNGHRMVEMQDYFGTVPESHIEKTE